MKHKVLFCAGVSLKRLFTEKKWYLILLVYLMFGYYTFSPLADTARYYAISVTPWTYPFFLSFYRMLVVHGGLCILLFADILEMDGYARFVLIRCGRRKYILGQMLYILIVSALYALIPYVCSLLFTLPALTLSMDWGTLLHTLAESSDQVIAQTGITVSIVVSQKLISIFSPLRATLLSFAFMWMSTVFMGMLIAFFTMLVHRMCALIAAGVIVSLSVFTMFIGGMAIGRWLIYISPLTWSDIQYLSWSGGGNLPTPAYAAAVLLGGAVIMGVIGSIRFVRRDLA